MADQDLVYLIMWVFTTLILLFAVSTIFLGLVDKYCGFRLCDKCNKELDDLGNKYK